MADHIKQSKQRLQELSSDEMKSFLGGSADPVLMVISNQDFWYQDYADTRASSRLEGRTVTGWNGYAP